MWFTSKHKLLNGSAESGGDMETSYLWVDMETCTQHHIDIFCRIQCSYGICWALLQMSRSKECTAGIIKITKTEQLHLLYKYTEPTQKDFYFRCASIDHYYCYRRRQACHRCKGYTHAEYIHKHIHSHIYCAPDTTLLSSCLLIILGNPSLLADHQKKNNRIFLFCFFALFLQIGKCTIKVSIYAIM